MKTLIMSVVASIILLLPLSQPANAQSQTKRRVLNSNSPVQQSQNNKAPLPPAPAPVVQAVAVPPPPPPPPPAYPLGSHEDWMNQAGIAPSDFGAVDYIVSHESGWNFAAVNSIGATGLCQSLPGSKMASAGDDYLTNPVTQLKWCTSYAASTYGGWWPAQQFWSGHRWW